MVAPIPEAKSIEDHEKNEYLGDPMRFTFLCPCLLKASNNKNTKMINAPYWKTDSNLRATRVYVYDSCSAVPTGSLIAYTHITNDSKIGINIKDLFQSFESSEIFLIIWKI